MAITSLTGTSWYINNNPTAASNIDYYHITFESRGTTFALITINDSASIVYDETDAYYFGDGWRYQMYRAITISGGDDVASQGLISWLEANAVQIEVDTLVNTSWIINDVPETMVGRAQYGQGTNLTFNIVGSDTEYSNFTWLSSSKLSYRIGPAVDHNYLDVYNNGTWVSNDYRIITITGGSEATLNFDRGWFQTNATPYVKPIEYVDKTVLLSGDKYYFKDTISGYLSSSDLVAGTNISIEENSEGKAVISSSSNARVRIIRLPEPALSDLTGTTWLFNSTLALPAEHIPLDVTFSASTVVPEPPLPSESITYNINFTTNLNGNNYNFTELTISSTYLTYVGDVSAVVYMGRNNTWVADSARTIAITGGTDAANQEFISWLKANATRVS